MSIDSRQKAFPNGRLLDVLRNQKLRQLRGELISPESFMLRWIPALYKIYPGDTDWRAACVSELADLLCTPEVLSLRTVRFWRLDRQSGYPAYLPVLLTALHNLYEIQECLSLLEHREVCVKLKDDPSWKRQNV